MIIPLTSGKSLKTVCSGKPAYHASEVRIISAVPQFLELISKSLLSGVQLFLTVLQTLVFKICPVSYKETRVPRFCQILSGASRETSSGK